MRWKRKSIKTWGGVSTLVATALLTAGCSSDALRVAVESQRRADDVQQAVFERQHNALCVLAYRDLVDKLEAVGGALSAEELQVLNAAWNDRDLFEFWLVQNERARALRTMGVDAHLYADQSIIDLWIKALEERADRVDAALSEGDSTPA